MLAPPSSSASRTTGTPPPLEPEALYGRASKLILARWPGGRRRFFDALYHTMMTSTTVGLGEYAPITQGGRAFAIVHIVISVGFFGALVGLLVSVQDELAQQRKKNDLLARTLDENL